MIARLMTSQLRMDELTSFVHVSLVSRKFSYFFPVIFSRQQISVHAKHTTNAATAATAITEQLADAHGLQSELQ